VVQGNLYLCATPIGNLEDITLRALRILKEVDLIAAEDTRHTQKLLNHFAIETQLTSYFEHNKREKGPQLVEYLRAGKNIALVSDAGTPGISDPGADLVILCVNAGINVVAIPGPSAVLSALVISGLPTDKFIFYGFLAKDNRKRERILSEARSQTATLIFYESPHRLQKTLHILLDVLGDRQAVAVRELTKRFEEIVRGTLVSLIDHFTEHAPRGEFTLVVAGISEIELEIERQELLPDPRDHVMLLVAQGEAKKQAIKQVAVLHNIPKREVYQLMLVDDEETK
jgi:16S rRNA (cytidine1402-2'-O)-methyltransferase